jgi:hypothetical protein
VIQGGRDPDHLVGRSAFVYDLAVDDGEINQHVG